MSELIGKTAIVTGASRGLGRGIALALAEKGADIVVNYRQSSRQAEQVCNEILAMGRHALPIQADVSLPGDVKRLFQQAQSEFKQIDIVVNNAGTNQPKDVFDISLDDWDHIIRSNLTSVFLCCQQAMSSMENQGSGVIVNISSIVGHRGALYGHLHYAATKSGILGVTKTLAYTAAPLGIRVNCVAPGIIETDLLHESHGAQEIEKLAAGVPLGLGTPRDVGLAVAFLVGEGGRYITGSTIDVNGGWYLR